MDLERSIFKLLLVSNHRKFLDVFKSQKSKNSFKFVLLAGNWLFTQQDSTPHSTLNLHVQILQPSHIGKDLSLILVHAKRNPQLLR